MIIRVATGTGGNPHIISISNEEMCPIIDEEIDQTAKAIAYVLGDSVPTNVLKRIHHHFMKCRRMLYDYSHTESL